jgi:CRP-like cAMP-binding protein
MAIDALVKPLLALPLFQGLTPLQLTEIVRRAERIIYRPGDVIIAEDKASDAAVIIISGNCIRLNESGDHAQRSRGETLPEGSMIAELAMLVELVHTATVIAQGPVKALRLTRQKMLELMEEDPALAQEFSSRIIARLKLLARDIKAVDTIADGTTIPAQSPQPRASLPSDARAS